ncbi:hypothetical protein S40285_10192 [Stachybotrys chlorohalonatus IBT 40285]|uniref:Uncharacterized protein n=1 Tax=Stachybotrys chlorohalonatus (strain IBT 40285) TaxID=1283841 RepID=A0A084QUE0_STAC4|nr:hypothetical protein S40285_10192 [Stachybotrys chlorohalonata IBT 40285]
MDDGETQRNHTQSHPAPLPFSSKGQRHVLIPIWLVPAPNQRHGSHPKDCVSAKAGVFESAATHETDPSQIDDEEDIRDSPSGHLWTIYHIILHRYWLVNWVQKQKWISPWPFTRREEKFSLLLSDWSDQAFNWHIRPGRKACLPHPLKGRRTTMLPYIVPPP